MRSIISLVARLVEAERDPSQITIQNDVTNFYSGQMDASLLALRGGKLMGKIDYSVYDDEPSIRMIEISPAFSRQGIATMLLRDLQARYPEAEISWGMLTDDGSKLQQATAFDEVPNPAVQQEFDRLAELHARFAQLTQQCEAMTAAGPPYSDEQLAALTAEWNEAHDVEYEIEQLEYALKGRKPTKRIIRQA